MDKDKELIKTLCSSKIQELNEKLLDDCFKLIEQCCKDNNITLKENDIINIIDYI